MRYLAFQFFRLRLLLLEEIKAEQGRDFGLVMGEVYSDSSSLNRDVGKAWVEVPVVLRGQ